MRKGGGEVGMRSGGVDEGSRISIQKPTLPRMQFEKRLGKEIPNSSANPFPIFNLPSQSTVYFQIAIYLTKIA
jgi:hypothetical protein